MKAIETRYKGYRFRSRLEARWAVFFDALGIPWEYEAEGYTLSDGTRYLPDFLIQLPPKPFWFEVKGQDATEQELNTCARFADDSDKYVFIASGTMDVPEVTTSGFRGAKILGFSPVSAWDRLPEDKIQRLSIRANAAMFYYGFYEAPDHSIEIDHLYAEDIPYDESGYEVPRVSHKFSAIGLIPVAYFGHGRAYGSERLRKAYATARSARFEFGESGAG